MCARCRSSCSEAKEAQSCLRPGCSAYPYPSISIPACPSACRATWRIASPVLVPSLAQVNVCGLRRPLPAAAFDARRVHMASARCLSDVLEECPPARLFLAYSAGCRSGGVWTARMWMRLWNGWRAKRWEMAPSVSMRHLARRQPFSPSCALAGRRSCVCFAGAKESVGEGRGKGREDGTLKNDLSAASFTFGAVLEARTLAPDRLVVFRAAVRSLGSWERSLQGVVSFVRWDRRREGRGALDPRLGRPRREEEG
ncbi:hypothetical protein B0H19DRAFT_159511 [Mycena capillaripes]|nr:hypothetical protein B0H19DRAFT_159511 [Mycena capillaripes]